MKLVLLILFIPFYTFSQSEVSVLDKTTLIGGLSYFDPILTNTKYYEACHKRLESYLSELEVDESFSLCTPDSLETIGEDHELIILTKYLELKTLNQRIARESHPVFNEYFESCQNRTAKLHLKLAQLAKSSYDISFQNRESPKFIEGSLPQGFKSLEFYGHDTDACFNSGLKAALVKPENEDLYIFVITGTEGSDTYSDGTKRESYSEMKKTLLGFGKEIEVSISARDADRNDWPNQNGLNPTGFNQFNTSCADKMAKKAASLVTKGSKVIFTGHSLGGALAQGLSYKSQAIANNPNYGQITSVGFMSAAGEGLNNPIERSIRGNIDSTVYVSAGDAVPSLSQVSSEHMGEVRLIERKDEIENKIVNRNEKLSAHDIDLTRYKPLQESTRIEAQEISNHNADYFKELSEKRSEFEIEKSKE